MKKIPMLCNRNVGRLIIMGLMVLSGCHSEKPVQKVDRSYLKPRLDTAEIADRPHGVTKAITVTPLGLHDPLGETVAVLFTWHVNGLELPDQTNAFLSPPSFQKGDRVMATLTPIAGERTGAAVPSNEIIVADEPTLLGNVALGYGPFYRASTLQPAVEWFDPDGDAVDFEYRWYVNGAEVAGQSNPILSGSFVRGDQVSVAARVKFE